MIYCCHCLIICNYILHILHRFAMENMWQGLDSVSRSMGEVNYTPCIPLVNESVAFEHPINNYPEV
jgi:hypothetical protein